MSYQIVENGRVYTVKWNGEKIIKKKGKLWTESQVLFRISPELFSDYSSKKHKKPHLKKKQKDLLKGRKNENISPKNHPKPHLKKLSEGQLWWRSLTLIEQADWRYSKMVKLGKKADWHHEYVQCEKEGLYRK